MSVSGVALYAALFLIPLYYQVVRVQSPLHTGLLLVPIGVGGFVGMPIAGKLSDQLGTRALVPFGGLAAGLAMLGYSQAPSATPLLVLAAYLFLFGVGISFVDAPTVSSVFRTVPPASASSATGTLFVVNQVFASLGVAVVALQLVGNAGREPLLTAYQGAFWWIAGAAALVVFGGVWLPGRPARKAREIAVEAVGEGSAAAEPKPPARPSAGRSHDSEQSPAGRIVDR